MEKEEEERKNQTLVNQGNQKQIYQKQKRKNTIDTSNLKSNKKLSFTEIDQKGKAQSDVQSDQPSEKQKMKIQDKYPQQKNKPAYQLFKKQGSSKQFSFENSQSNTSGNNNIDLINLVENNAEQEINFKKSKQSSKRTLRNSGMAREYNIYMDDREKARSLSDDLRNLMSYQSHNNSKQMHALHESYSTCANKSDLNMQQLIHSCEYLSDSATNISIDIGDIQTTGQHNIQSKMHINK